ncbi:acetyl-coenzyme A synthetase, cytoplasmic [Caerostris extrusa]|uniref:Acetyl-coenzyme A synthetase, cytoplasmic n=1 Tax=Caerostris extrusa TaxID=172846 RepID=A0AAV4X8A5_CAEEX|nr:acetyl-coenzyme A synthetase, cytoplasmic [Caerostris extrusa]
MGYKFDESIVQELTQKVEHQIGPFARPEYFHHATALPKTRSGKTVRRILRKVATNDSDLGDLSTLVDESVVQVLFNSKNI